MRSLSILPMWLHVALESVLGVLLVLAPFVLGFDDVTAALAMSVTAGVLILVSMLISDHASAATRLLPLRAHEAFDYVLALMVIITPFATGLVGEDEHSTAVVALIVAGLVLLVATAITAFPHKSTAAPVEPLNDDEGTPRE